MTTEHRELNDGQHEQGHHTITIMVNEQPVRLNGHTATGSEIKAAAIDQGMQIEHNFVLLVKVSDDITSVIDDEEEVPLHEHLPFIAISNEQQTITVTVNEQSVKIHGCTATGSEIKVAAIDQGVQIEQNYVLLEEVSDDSNNVIEDNEKVHLHENFPFIAISHEQHTVTVSVNEQPVKLHGGTSTGAAIKAAAIAQGVHIQQNFVLQEELPNGTSRNIGDNDHVHLREHLRFTAIAPDDNSQELSE
jgi:sulfur carrier protein ThiS